MLSPEAFHRLENERTYLRHALENSRSPEESEARAARLADVEADLKEGVLPCPWCGAEYAPGGTSWMCGSWDGRQSLECRIRELKARVETLEAAAVA